MPREATRRRFTEALCQAVIGDGTPWIWKIAQQLFPRTIQIVHRFHVNEHFTKLAKAIYGGQSAEAQVWVQHRHHKLDADRFPVLLRAVRHHADRSDEVRKCFQYLHRDRERMRYPQFQPDGLCTSSGPVEAGSKSIPATRLRQSEIR